PGGVEPPYGGFADLCLTTWLRRRGGSESVGRRSNNQADRPELRDRREGHRLVRRKAHLADIGLHRLAIPRPAHEFVPLVRRRDELKAAQAVQIGERPAAMVRS